MKHLDSMRNAIADTPAESIFGVGVKLTALKFYADAYDEKGWARKGALLHEVGALAGVDFAGLTKQAAL